MEFDEGAEIVDLNFTLEDVSDSSRGNERRRHPRERRPAMVLERDSHGRSRSPYRNGGTGAEDDERDGEVSPLLEGGKR